MTPDTFSTAMSNAGDVACTRAVVVVPSGRRMVTVESVPTTCTLVRMVSGVTKKPLPRDDAGLNA